MQHAGVSTFPTRRSSDLTGGPTQTDTFDMKPGHANGGEFKEKETKVPGLKFSEHLPKLASMSDQLADRKSTRLNSSHLVSSYAVFCVKKKRDQESMKHNE